MKKNNTNFIEIANYCTTRYIDSLKTNKDSNYERSHYFSILEDNSVQYSQTTHFLENACSCLIIHERKSLAISRWHSWYQVEYIDPVGRVLPGNIDERFKITIHGEYSFQELRLYFGNTIIYADCSQNWGKAVPKMWEVYQVVKACQTENEAAMAAKLMKKDIEIAQLKENLKEMSFSEMVLKKELSEYKSLLNDIKQLLQQKE